MTISAGHSSAVAGTGFFGMSKPCGTPSALHQAARSAAILLQILDHRLAGQPNMTDVGGGVVALGHGVARGLLSLP